MPGIINTNVVGRREFLMDMIYQADNRQCVFTSMVRKPSPSNNEKTGIPNSTIGTYQAKVLGSRKGGGVADGRDVAAFDSNPVRELISFRPEKYHRAPMVGDLAKDDVVAGLPGGEWNEAISDQMVELKRDMEKEFLSVQDSSATGGAEGGTKTRGLGSWIDDGTLTWAELAPPSTTRTPTGQLFTDVIGDGMATGLTEAAVQTLLQTRWDNTGDSGELVGFLGATIKNRFGDFTKYKPNISNTTVIVRTNTDGYTTGDLHSASVDVYNSDWGSFSLIPVNTTFLPNAKTGYFLDMAQVELRSRYWMREKPLPDLGGGPREEIANFVALIPGDLRSHVRISAT